MGNSLYEIGADIQNIFAQVEEAEGEITEEQVKLLEIKQDELVDKLNSYYKAIKIWSSDAETCKAEKKRINDVQNKYKNRVDRLKKSMLAAVLEFGNNGKTNKFIELDTVRLSSKTTKSIKENIIRINELIRYFREYIDGAIVAEVLGNGEEPDIEGILDVINANYKAELTENEEYIPYTVDDLKALHVNVNNTQSLYNLLMHGDLILKTIAYYELTTNVENVTVKEDYKKYLDNITIAKEVNNQSLLIK